MNSSRSQRMISLAAATLTLMLIFSSTPTLSLKFPTIFQTLVDYGFPTGLLPHEVKGYDLDSSTGEFSAYFNETCTFTVAGSYQLKLQPTIKGIITRANVSKLEGVSVKVLLVSRELTRVLRRGDNLVFTAGFESVGFPIDNFEEPAYCGCGFKCSV